MKIIMISIEAILFALAFPGMLAASLRLLLRNMQPRILSVGIGFLYASSLTMNGVQNSVILPIAGFLEAHGCTDIEVKAVLVLLLAIQVAFFTSIAFAGIKLTDKLKEHSQPAH